MVTGVSSLDKCPFRPLVHFFLMGCFFFFFKVYIELHEPFAYFGDKFLVSKFSSKHFFPIPRVSFFLVWFTVSLAVQTFLRIEKLKSFVEFVFNFSLF